MGELADNVFVSRQFREYPEVTDLIWDIDNTIWDWVKLHGLGMEAMAGYLSEAMGISQEEAEAQLKKGYERQVLLDFGNVIQMIPAVRDRIGDVLKAGPTEESMLKYTHWITELVTGARDAYSEIRGANFTLFDGAAEVMEANKERGGRNFVITDSPLYKAIERLGRVGVDQHVDMVWAAEDPRIKQTPNAVKRRVERFIQSPMLGQVSSQHKPNINLSELLNVSRDYVRQHVAVIGDSKEKDMWMAHLNECVGFYAKYGQPSKEDLERMLRFAPDNQQEARKTGVSENDIDSMMINNENIRTLNKLRDLAKYLRLDIAETVTV